MEAPGEGKFCAAFCTGSGSCAAPLAPLRSDGTLTLGLCGADMGESPFWSKVTQMCQRTSACLPQQKGAAYKGHYPRSSRAVGLGPLCVLPASRAVGERTLRGWVRRGHPSLSGCCLLGFNALTRGLRCQRAGQRREVKQGKKMKLREYFKEMGGAPTLQEPMTRPEVVPCSDFPDPGTRLLSVPSRHSRIRKIK